MSVVGISPTDIAKAAKIGRKAICAIGKGNRGSQHQYQKAKNAIALRVRVLEELSASIASPGAMSESVDLYRATLQDDRCLQESLSRFESTLGIASSQSRLSGIKSKLQYAFGGADQVQKDVDDSKPNLDAVILRKLLYVWSLYFSS